ncbi:PKS ER domain-containing protein [Citrus sinensis]|uniref:PKS ER domain-containing protein n=1 Tax=Citrus sinensis TaxID=2711 RepID=A0ACB8IEM6_CITSI|nr:PKS ER domain-containing protein [Citrus sinensis]
MELKPGLSAFVTGGASGIGKNLKAFNFLFLAFKYPILIPILGRALSLALAGKGVFVTVVDLSEEKGKEVAALVEKENAKFYSNLGFPSATFIRCDVANTRDTAAAFEKHVATYGGLDICINSAGIGNSIPFHEDQTDGTRSWRFTVDVNLVAVIDCTQKAIGIMQAAKKPGVIINMGSSAGLYPLYTDPIYSASKGGVVLFTRSLTPYKSKGIRINVLCPEFVETELALKAGSKLIDLMGGFVPMDTVVKGITLQMFKSDAALIVLSYFAIPEIYEKSLAPHPYAVENRAFELITDESKAGSCLWITNRRGMEYWPTSEEEAKYSVRSSGSMKRFSS